jgi:hypothetical protein
MIQKTTWLSVLLVCLMTSLSFAQTAQERQKIKDRMNVANLQQLSNEFETESKNQKLL